VRSREIAVRAALGATRWRIAGQFLGESFVLALGGALLGIPIAYVGIGLFRAAIAQTEPPYWIRFELDAVPLLFVCGAILLVTLAAGTLPAWQSSRANTRDALQDQSRGSSSFRLGRINRALTVLESTLAVALLAAAGLMIRSVAALHRMDFGFAAERVLHADILPSDTAHDASAQLPVFAGRLFERVAALPGVEALALTVSAPGVSGPRQFFRVRGLSGDTSDEELGNAQPLGSDPPRRPEDNALPLAANIAVTPGFFALFDAPVLRGRDFQSGDVAGALPVAIVNRAFEQRYFGAGGALGGQLQPAEEEADGPWLTIVGVVPDLFASGMRSDVSGAAIYRPIAQSARLEGLSVVARARTQPAALVPSLREAVAALDADAALLRVGSLRDVVRAENSIHVIFGSLFMTFGVAALFLASVGLYGVMAFSVGQRRRELGVRLAVGANHRDVLRLVMWQGLRQTMVGLVLGTALALAISRVLSALLFQVSPQDPLTFAGVVFVLLASASLASYVPARRAMRANPIDALRME
jgi:predicted permease